MKLGKEEMFRIKLINKIQNIFMDITDFLSAKIRKLSFKREIITIDEFQSEIDKK